MAEKPVALDDSIFEAEVIQSNIPVLVDFWAEWCGPCKIIAPTIEKLADEYKGKAKICKLDVDKNPVNAEKFNIRSIPTLLFFKDGVVRDQVIGVMPIDQLTKKLDNLLE